MQLKQSLAFLFVAGALYAQLPLRLDPKDVVAIVDGKEVTRGEVQKILQAAGPQFMSLFQINPANALSQWFLREHLGKEGAALKLDEKSPLKEEIEARRIELLADARFNLEMNGYQVPLPAIQKYYDLNQTRFQRVRVSGVYFKYKPKESQQGTSTADLARMAQEILSAGQQQRTEEEARALALDIAKRLRAGEEMTKLAEQYSEDPASKAKGGDIGYISTTSAFPPEFIAAALGIAKGAVSDPIRLSAGFYVLRADEKSPMPLSEASPEIETELKKVHLDEYMKALNERFRLVVKDQTLSIQPGVLPAGTIQNGPVQPKRP